MALNPKEELELLELEEEEYQYNKNKNIPKDLPNVSKMESLGRGALQGSTAGFSDEIGGAVQGAMDKVSGMFGGDSVTEVNKKLADQGFTGMGPTDTSGLYSGARDENRKADFDAKQANPKMFIGGELAGVLGTSFIPGLSATKGMSAIEAASKAAGMGALQSAGSTTNSLNSIEGLKDAGKGALIGGVAGGLGQAMSNKIASIGDAKNASNMIKRQAELQSAKAQGLERGTMRKIGEDRARAVGRQGLDNFEELGGDSVLGSGIFGNNADEMIDANQILKKTAMGKRSGVYDLIDEANASNFNPGNVAQDVVDEVGQFNWNSPLNKAKFGQMDDSINAITQRGGGDLSMKEAQNLIEELAQSAKFDATRATPANDMAQGIYKTVRNSINDSAENAATTMGKPGLKDILQKSNKQFSVGKDADILHGNKLARGFNKDLGLTDMIVASGNPVLLPGKKLWERTGNRYMAKSFDKIGDMVNQNPNAFGKFSGVLQQATQRGPQAVAATHFLLQQQDPEYVELLKQMQGEEK